MEFDDPWIIRSPLPDQQIDDLEVFILVEIDDDTPPDPASIDLLIDGVDYSSRAKITSSSISLLYSRGLTPGRHSIQLTGRTLDGTELQKIIWYFIIPGDVDFASTESASSATTPRSSPVPYLRGKTYIDTRNSDLTGNRDLRQEPARSYAVRADVEGEYGGFRFPVKLYLSTDESSAAQPRNRFLVGAESKYVSLLAGDTTPRYNSLIMSGARTRGVQLSTGVPGARLTANYGIIQRGVQGARIADSFSVDPFSSLPGSYQRTLSAFKLDFGNPNSVQFSLSALKSKDDIASVNIGADPLGNLVAGTGLKIALLKERLKFESGAAMSITTEDISRGASDKSEIDSLFNTDIPINPADFDWLITLNPTTIPLRLDKLSSLAWFVNSRASSFGHVLSTEYRSVGSSFFSAGNPYMQSNRNTITISDRFRHANGVVSGVLRFQHYGTPDGDATLGTSIKSNLFSSQVNLAPGTEWPRFSVGYRIQLRERQGSDPQLLTSNSRLTTYSFGTIYSLRTGSIGHGINVFGTRSVRTDRLTSSVQNSSYSLSAGVNERLPWPVVLNLQGTYVFVRYPELSTSQEWLTVGTTVGYRWADPGFRLTANTKITHSSRSAFSAATSRYGFSLRGRYDVQKNQSIELQAGVDTFRHDEDLNLRFTERFFVVRHRYTF